MLYFPQTRIELSVERPLVAGAVINAEGAALAGVNSASGYGVQSTTGTNDVFAGVAINNPMTTEPVAPNKIHNKLLRNVTNISGLVNTVR